MNRNELQKSLKILRDELDQIGDPDNTVQEKIKEVIDSLEQHMADPENTGHKDSVLEHLQKNIERFEVEHPRITGIMGRIMMTLSDMGI